MEENASGEVNRKRQTRSRKKKEKEEEKATRKREAGKSYLTSRLSLFLSKEQQLSLNPALYFIENRRQLSIF